MLDADWLEEKPLLLITLQLWGVTTMVISHLQYMVRQRVFFCRSSPSLYTLSLILQMYTTSDSPVHIYNCVRVTLIPALPAGLDLLSLP